MFGCFWSLSGTNISLFDLEVLIYCKVVSYSNMITMGVNKGQSVVVVVFDQNPTFLSNISQNNKYLGR